MSKKSSTERLAADIEMMTGAMWGREQRLEICELIRKYRFLEVSAVLGRIQKLVRESGNVDLSDKIFLGKIGEDP
jgi:hypothetical protein